ncbi:EGF-like domain protein [Trichuris suis]|nr:EGF-like domain protein [Trichuris suis]
MYCIGVKKPISAPSIAHRMCFYSQAVRWRPSWRRCQKAPTLLTISFLPKQKGRTDSSHLSRSLSAYILGSTERRNLWLFPLPPWSIMVLLCCGWSWHILRVESCATRPSPRTRPLRPTWSPDIHVEYENCTEDYAALFCLNDGICFRTKIVDTFIISCECKPGWYGRRCEYQDIGDRYLPVQQRVEVASIAGSLTVLIVVIVFVSVVLYIYYRRRRTAVELMDDPNVSLTDPFGHQVGSLSRENSFLYNEKTPTMVISLKPVPDGVAQESSTKQTLV